MTPVDVENCKGITDGKCYIEMTQPPNMSIIDLSDRLWPVESVVRSEFSDCDYRVYEC